MSDFMVTSFQSDTAYSYRSVFIRNLEQTNCFPQKYDCSIIFLSNPYTLWVISCPCFYEIFILLIELLKIAYQWIHSSFRFLLELESLFLHSMTIFHMYFCKQFPRTLEPIVVQSLIKKSVKNLKTSNVLLPSTTLKGPIEKFLNIIMEQFSFSHR